MSGGCDPDRESGYPMRGVDRSPPSGDSGAVDPETREALERLEYGLRAEIQASATATHRLIAESEDRTRVQFEDVRAEFVDVRGLITQADDRTRVEFADVRSLITQADDRTRAEFLDVRALITQVDDRTRAEFTDVRGLITQADERTQAQFEDIRGRLEASEGRTRRHFDVVAESLRGDIRSLAVGMVVAAESSLRRDTELGERIDRLEHRVLGVESRVSILEGHRRRRRRR
jgi:hypothetical protein